MVTRQQHDEATERSRQMLETTPRAISARYDPASAQVIVELSSGFTLSFRKERAEGIEAATPEQLAQIEISPSGYGVRFPQVDADLWVPAMLIGVFGTKRWELGWTAAHPEHMVAA